MLGWWQEAEFSTVLGRLERLNAMEQWQSPIVIVTLPPSAAGPTQLLTKLVVGWGVTLTMGLCPFSMLL